MNKIKATATIDVSAIKSRMAVLRRVSERRNTIPILGCALVSIEAERVVMMASDLDIYATATVEASTSDKAAFAVPMRALSGFVGCAKGAVTLTLQENNTKGFDQLVLTEQGGMAITLNCLYPCEDFPTFYKGALGDDGAYEFEASQDQLLRLLGLGRHCISTEETRYYLNGAYLTGKPEGETIRCVTTDGHRLGVIDSDLALPTNGAPSAILPTKLIMILLESLTKGGNAPVTIAGDRLRLTLECDWLKIQSKLIDGTYPDYTRVIPKEEPKMMAHVTRFGVQRLATMAGALNYGSQSAAANFNLNDGTLSYVSPDRSHVSMPLQCEGEGAFGFNAKYLAAQARVTPEFSLRGHHASAPFKVFSEDPDAFWVMMPMRV